MSTTPHTTRKARRVMAIADLVLLVAYLVWWTTLAWARVGTVTKSSATPVEWHFPFMILVMLLIPTVLAYSLGKHAASLTDDQGTGEKR